MIKVIPGCVLILTAAAVPLKVIFLKVIFWFVPPTTLIIIIINIVNHILIIIKIKINNNYLPIDAP